MAIDTTITPPPPPPPPPAARPGRRAAGPTAAPSSVRVRRRWGRFAAGATLALLGAWISAMLFVSVGNRVEVVAVARDVDKFGKLEKDDLRTVRVAADPSIDTIAASQLDELVGRYAAVDLTPGTLLSPKQLVRKDAQVVAPDESVVGIELDPGDAPASLLEGGTDVLVVIGPKGTGGGEAPRAVPGWLLRINDTDEDSGKRLVDVVVSESSAPDVAAASADDRVTLAALEVD
jgi:hypothetical protein